MALEDFLGKTSEIRIIDFLSGNGDINYNQSEISECTGLSRTTINHKIPFLIYNGILEIKKTKGNVNYYQLKDNKIIKGLIGSVFANSFFIAEQDGEYNEILNNIKQDVGPILYEEINCFCYSEDTSMYVVEDTKKSWSKEEREWPTIPVSSMYSEDMSKFAVSA